MSNYIKKNWDEFLLPNGKTVEFMRKNNVDWWVEYGQESERPEARKVWYDKFLFNAQKNNPDFFIKNYAGKNLKVGEACGGPYGGVIEMFLPYENKYQIDIFADSFKSLNWLSSDGAQKTTWIEAPCEEIPLEDNFLDVAFAFNSIDHGWNVFESISEIVRVSKECYVSFDTNKYIHAIHSKPSLNHYQKVVLEKVIVFMDNNFSNKKLYDMKYLTWKPDPDSHIDVFDFWVRKK